MMEARKLQIRYKTTFLLRRGRAEAWQKNNPVLAYGEPGFDLDNYGLKIGDGKTAWNDLKFLSTDEEEIKQIMSEFIFQELVAEDQEIIDLIIEEDMLPAVADSDGGILSDENGDIILW